MRFSVIIPTWNGRKLLHLPLDSLRAQSFSDFEVIVVDDASGDDTVDWVAANYPEVKLVKLTSNKGFPGAVNAGIRAATGEVVALLNNDAAADPEWLNYAHQALEAHPEAGMLACRVQLYHHREYLDSAGIFASTGGSIGNRATYQKDGPEHARRAWVLGPNGAAAFYRQSVFAEVGLFDEDYIAYHEDTDMALRAQLHGWKCLYEPRCLCFHVGSATYSTLPLQGAGGEVTIQRQAEDVPRPPRTSDKVLFLAARNYPTLLLKFVPWKVLLADSWAIAAYEVNMVYFAWRHKQIRSYVRGRVDFLRRLPVVWRKRREVARERTVGEREVAQLFDRPTLWEYARILRRRLKL